MSTKTGEIQCKIKAPHYLQGAKARKYNINLSTFLNSCLCDE